MKKALVIGLVMVLTVGFIFAGSTEVYAWSYESAVVVAGVVGFTAGLLYSPVYVSYPVTTRVVYYDSYYEPVPVYESSYGRGYRRGYRRGYYRGYRDGWRDAEYYYIDY